jgi:hypothetical protein
MWRGAAYTNAITLQKIWSAFAGCVAAILLTSPAAVQSKNPAFHVVGFQTQL